MVVVVDLSPRSLVQLCGRQHLSMRRDGIPGLAELKAEIQEYH
jgi:hypothetical protein